MIGMTIHGAHKGFAALFSKTVSLLTAVIVVVQLSGIVNNYRTGSGSDVLIGILMLVMLGVVYKIMHAILKSIRFIAGLPVLSGADKVLGVILGFCEGFLILYIAEYLLRMYLLQ